MRFYTQPHRFYCGGDLHARTLYLHVLDADGRTRFDQNLPATPDAFRAAITPFRDGLVVGVEWLRGPYPAPANRRARRFEEPACGTETIHGRPGIGPGPPPAPARG
jgi:hypothetical protein